MRREQPDPPEEFPLKEIGAWLAQKPPPDWKAPEGDPERWSEAWADEILPVARAPHRRLGYMGVTPKEERGVVLATGFAREKNMPDGIPYKDWAADVAAIEIHKAGWRLAALLEASLQ